MSINTHRLECVSHPSSQEFGLHGDTCYIAHCYPYSFTDLKNDLDRLSLSRPADVLRRDVLCESHGGNSCFILTVTDECMSMRGVEGETWKRDRLFSLRFLAVPIDEKKFAIITARIHPGETNSSYMMRGLLEFITSDDRIAAVRHSSMEQTMSTRHGFLA